MNNSTTRRKARLILQDAFDKIYKLDLPFNIICSSIFFNRNFEVTDDSRTYTVSSNDDDDELFETQVECLFDEIKGIKSPKRRRHKLRKMKFIAKTS